MRQISGPTSALSKPTSADLVRLRRRRRQAKDSARLAGTRRRPRLERLVAVAENAGATLVGDELSILRGDKLGPRLLLQDLAISGTVGARGRDSSGKGQLADVPNPTPALKTASDAALRRSRTPNSISVGPAYDSRVEHFLWPEDQVGRRLQSKMAEISQRWLTNTKPTSRSPLTISRVLFTSLAGQCERAARAECRR